TLFRSAAGTGQQQRLGRNQPDDLRARSTDGPHDGKFAGAFNDGGEERVENAKQADHDGDAADGKEQRAHRADEIENGAHHFGKRDDLRAGDFLQSLARFAQQRRVAQADGHGGQAARLVEHFLRRAERHEKQAVVARAAAREHAGDAEFRAGFRAEKPVARRAHFNLRRVAAENDRIFIGEPFFTGGGKPPRFQLHGGFVKSHPQIGAAFGGSRQRGHQERSGHGHGGIAARGGERGFGQRIFQRL